MRMNRAEAMERLRAAAEKFDVLIVGGGATGLGAAIDAAARGYRVALVEQVDFAKGTSSRSTKLAHGGVRYLKQGNLSLVHEALRERGRLAHNAPHLVRPLSFVIPSYGRWEKTFYGVGMKIYDAMSGRFSLGQSRSLSRAETIAALPTVETAGLIGGVEYFDGQFDDARLAVNLAQTATDLGAVAANYCACFALLKKNGRVDGAMVRDVETGDEFAIQARAVVNATGVFVDAVRTFDDTASSPLVTVSQGIHLVLPKSFLPGESALMVPKTRDGRVLFAVPWHDRVIVGTTDTPGVGVDYEPRALAEERSFVMEHACRYLAKDPADSDVLSVYAGLRPLVRAGGGGNTAALSRDHTIVVSAAGLISVTGGKWTTYRRMAEDVINQAERVGDLGRRAGRTADRPIHGAVQMDRTRVPFSVYGSDAPALDKLIEGDATLAALLHSALPYCRAEVVWQVRQEMARTVEDVLARRTRALMLDARAAADSAPEVARLLAAELGRDATWMDAQTCEFRALARRYTYTDSASTAPDSGAARPHQAQGATVAQRVRTADTASA